MKLRQPKRRRLSEQVAQEILRQIAEGRLRPGDRLPTESQLVQQLAVGRSSVREALHSLAAMRVLQIRHGHGIYVEGSNGAAGGRQLDFTLLLGSRDVLNLVEARKLLEVQIAALAAERAAAEDLERMHACVDRMRRARGRSTYLKADIDFHLAVAQATHNDVLVGLLRTLRQLIHSTLQHSPTPSEEGTRQHEHIYERVAARDPAAASRAIYEHLDEVEERTRAEVDVALRGATCELGVARRRLTEEETR